MSSASSTLNELNHHWTDLSWITTLLPSVELLIVELSFGHSVKFNQILGCIYTCLFGTIESNSSSFTPLLRIFWGRYEYSNRTQVRTKQLYRDPAEEVVSVLFKTNSGTDE